METIETYCTVCEGYFETLVDFNDFCCCSECYETYYSIEYRRDMKINNLLNYAE
jgi:hypothetical protein